MPLPIRFVVVSCPAIISSTQFAKSSSSVESISLLFSLDQRAQQILLRVKAELDHPFPEVGRQSQNAFLRGDVKRLQLFSRSAAVDPA